MSTIGTMREAVSAVVAALLLTCLISSSYALVHGDSDATALAHKDGTTSVLQPISPDAPGTIIATELRFGGRRALSVARSKTKKITSRPKHKATAAKKRSKKVTAAKKAMTKRVEDAPSPFAPSPAPDGSSDDGSPSPSPNGSDDNSPHWGEWGGGDDDDGHHSHDHWPFWWRRHGHRHWWKKPSHDNDHHRHHHGGHGGGGGGGNDDDDSPYSTPTDAPAPVPADAPADGPADAPVNDTTATFLVKKAHGSIKRITKKASKKASKKAAKKGTKSKSHGRG